MEFVIGSQTWWVGWLRSDNWIGVAKKHALKNLLWAGALSWWSTQLPSWHSSGHLRWMCSLRHLTTVDSLTLGNEFTVHNPANVEKNMLNLSPDQSWILLWVIAVAPTLVTGDDPQYEGCFILGLLMEIPTDFNTVMLNCEIEHGHLQVVRTANVCNAGPAPQHGILTHQSYCSYLQHVHYCSVCSRGTVSRRFGLTSYSKCHCTLLLWKWT